LQPNKFFSNSFLMFIDSILYSYAQIFFSNRRWLGALILLVSMLMPTLGLMGLLGVIISNVSAAVLKFDSVKIRSGFYGFNGILFGAAIAYFYPLDLFLLMLIPIFVIITFFISSVLEHYLASSFNLPGLSLPFIVSLYIFLIFLTNYSQFIHQRLVFPYDTYISWIPNSIQLYFKSISLIIFQPGVLSGIIIAIGVLIFSRVLFTLSIISYLVSILFLNFLLPQAADNLIIVVGFNAILTSFALGGSLILPSKKSFVLVLISSIIVVIFTGFFYKLFSTSVLPILVLPFNFIVLSVIYSLKFRKEQSDLVLLYFSPGSPEENLYYHNNRSTRFDRFKYFFPELPFYGEWYVSQGFDGQYTHKDKWRFAWDFIVVDENKTQFSNDGNKLNDYYCFKMPVSSVLDGKVVKVIQSIPNNEVGEVNLDKNWGNTIIIDHGEGLLSATSHLDPDTIKVKENDYVLKGDVIGTCGNSGRSPYPHIHFQFQITEKVGDKTYLFPFAHFIEKHDDKLVAKSFDYPKQDTIIQNIVVNKSIKKAFNLKLGDKYDINFELNGKKFQESWEVKVDIYNLLYIVNDKHDIAYIYLTEKVFYFSNYTGTKKSALYHYFLSAYQVPLCYSEKLVWEDEYAPSQVLGTSVRFLSEFFLSFKNFIQAKANFSFTQSEDSSTSFNIKNIISVYGSGFLSFYKKEYRCNVDISDSGYLDSYSVTDNKDYQFFAKILLSNGE